MPDLTTVGKLSEAWNALRNAALGRGVELPAGMNSELSDEVGTAYEGWRAWLQEQGPLSEAQREITLAGAAGEWADRYEVLAAKVTAATGVKLPAVPTTPVERAAEQAGAVLRPWASLVVFGVGVTIGVALLRSMRGARR